MKEQPKPYTTTPRYIPDDVRSGRMSRPEWRVYQWLRINADPYGKVSTSLTAIREDVYWEVETNQINQILLSLKAKNYLYYLPRQGQRGSFNVYFGDWLRPDGTIQHLENHPIKNPARRKAEVGIEVKPEDRQTSSAPIQKLNEQKKGLAKAFSAHQARPGIRSSYNDTENEKDNESTLVKKSLKRTLVGDFRANSYEEETCQRIAAEIGDEYVNPILHILKTRGFAVIERAYGIYREHLAEGKLMDDKRRYFMGIVSHIQI